MAEAQNMIAPLMRDMSFESLSGESRVRGVAMVLMKCFDSEERALRSTRYINAADALIGRPINRSFEQRIETLERKVRELETAK